MYKLFLCFFSGFVLSSISFRVLPIAFLSIGVYLSALFILLGIIFFSLYESKLKPNDKNFYSLFVAFSLAIIAFDFITNIPAVIISFCGGILLYASSDIINPSYSKGHKYRPLMYFSSIFGIFVGILVSL